MNGVLLAILLQAAGGIVAMMFSRLPRVATLIGAGATVLGCLLGVAPTLRVLCGGASEALRLSWDATHGAFSVEVDPLSAFFLLPVFVLSGLAAVYGGDYLMAYREKKSLGIPWFFFNIFVAGMVMVLIARTALLFLLAWEVMSIAAYCLVTFEHEKAEVREAGWIYLIATHLGVIFLFITFSLLGRYAGGLEFRDFQTMSPLGPGLSGLVFVLALIGFGAKAGFVPFHVWLPEAHPAAPSHVSALMSGVMIKMGLYGILRILTFLGCPPSWWGQVMVGIGLLTGLVGISLAMHQRDAKRVLAYSSIENMGLIALALGTGLWGMAKHLPIVAVLGLGGALLHTWNHALMKGLVFLAAGSILHGTGTKDMERLGGLMKRMPWTGTAMVFGGVAIAALPPLNGFVSKWLMYLGILKYGLTAGGSDGLAAILAAGLLSLIGGLAGIAFVRLAGIALLGSPRSEAANHAHESSSWMLAPIMILLALCVAVAVVPQGVVELMSGVLGQILGQQRDEVLLAIQASDTSLKMLGIINAWTLGVVGLTVGVLLAWTRRAGLAEGPTWGCGYVRPTARIQYTGRSFAEMLAEHLLPRFLRPRTSRRLPHELFPVSGEFSSESPDPLYQRVYQPLFTRWANRFTRLRVLQQGKIHVYLMYIMFMVVLALAWVSFRTWWRIS